jgi:hypothetical protein
MKNEKSESKDDASFRQFAFLISQFSFLIGLLLNGGQARPLRGAANTLLYLMRARRAEDSP